MDDDLIEAVRRMRAKEAELNRIARQRPPEPKQPRFVDTVEKIRPRGGKRRAKRFGRAP